ncbi:HEPN/Toprim-associated domain-containing protein [uncultured Chitinophaga sp.]|uniref:HEPN/Toprim-associated domain-containing protein n=1 Tax=uncultured Chitinophaga sp. TaxID=339340 RepID=UPI0025DCF8BC|nr:HEPN/Toprim-associated domain-containing protein [uncultured Chitinophaga sp.]
MGHYSTLNIGTASLHWKYKIPNYLAFLFDQGNLYFTIPSEESEDDEMDQSDGIGFKTTVKDALEKLNELGFDWNLMTRTYCHFYEDLKLSLLEYIGEDLIEDGADPSSINIDELFANYLTGYGQLSREEELKDFVQFIFPLLWASQGEEDALVKSIDGKTYSVEKSNVSYTSSTFLYDPWDFLYSRRLKFPPWVVMIANLFDYDYREDYSEIISMLQIKLLLEASHPEDSVVLDLEDIIEDTSDIEEFHIESAKAIVDKIELYNAFFQSVINKSNLVKETYFKKELLSELQRVEGIVKTQEKGRALEMLIAAIFDSADGLTIQKKNINTGNQEIDILIKNNVNRPFWTSLGSPFFL